ncbi:MAG: tetratricopeptide repeat protein, partial [candidate division WOR-3 bacterium]
FYSDKHENFAFGLFLGTRYSITKWLDVLLEGDGRDINLGVQCELGRFQGEVSLTKFEGFIFGENEPHSVRLNSTFSFRLPFFEGKGKKEKWEPVIAEDKIYFDVDFEDIEVTGMVPQKINDLEKQRTVTSEDYKPVTPEAVKLFLEATELFEAGEYDEARIRFEKALRGLGEYRKEALFRIGECYYNTGNYKKALSIFYSINSESRDTYLYPESIYAITACHIALKNWDEAERSLSALTSEYPGYKDSDKTKVSQAIIAFGQEHYEEVTELLKDIETKEALFYKAKAYFFINDPRNSLAAFKKITDEYPESPLARYSSYYMGDVLFFSGNYSGALYKYVDFLEKY